MKLSDIKARAETVSLREELAGLLEVLDPEHCVTINNVFDSPLPFPESFLCETNYPRELYELYGAENYKQEVEKLEIRAIREIIETILFEYEFYYGLHYDGKYSFYEVFYVDYSWIDLARDIPKLENVENPPRELINPLDYY